MAMTLDAIRTIVLRAMAPTIRRVNGMVRRGVVRRVKDSARQQLLQLSLLEDEVADDVENCQPFGLSFVPPTGSEAAVIAVAGNGEYPLALGVGSRDHRPTEVRSAGFGDGGGGGGIPRGLREGEGGLYSLDGWRLFVDDDGNIYLGGGPDRAIYKLARADLVEAEFGKVKAALDAAQSPPGTTGGPLEYTPPTAQYSSVGAVGSDHAKVIG